MSGNVKKASLILAAASLLIGVSRVQTSLNHDREALGLTRVPPLENAPPVLAFTTVALGGFRGLISNALWMRASDLQDEDKFFEMAQLADWITKLEPHFVQVWLVQAWNMAYNISVKFKDYPDRWRWLSRGIELLRDDGLRYNPDETLIYRELAWFFQHKLGQNLDDANMYYKQQWSLEMAKVFGKKKPNLDELIDPKTPDERERAKLLREKFKMDPKFMKEVDERYGPLEWRLPEAHAIYWAALGLKKAQQDPSRIPKKDDLMTLRRVIYQSMQLSFQRGRLIPNPVDQMFDFGPNLEIIPKVSAAYEEQAQLEPEMHDHILRAHRNFLRDAVYFLYENNRMKDAAYWFKYLGQHYPNQPLIDGRTNSLPGTVTLDQYAVFRVQDDVKDDVSRDRIRGVIEGYLFHSYMSLIEDDEDRATGLMLLAKGIRDGYIENTKARPDALYMPPLEELKKIVLNRLLDPEHGLPPEGRAILRTKLRLPEESVLPESPTNAPPSAGTNAPPVKPSSE